MTMIDATPSTTVCYLCDLLKFGATRYFHVYDGRVLVLGILALGMILRAAALLIY